jgi:D-methionine transport system substrate-binding protein
MKKFFAKLFAIVVLAITFTTFASCGDKGTTIRVGASSTPHAEILSQIKGDLKKQGYNLEIRIMDDYVTPNIALDEGELDANYFQHLPYLTNFNAENETHLVSAGAIHYEPFGVYGKGVSQTDFDTNKTGRTILIPSDGSNSTRALFVLQQEGYITLRDGVSASDTLSDQDIADSKGNTVRLFEASTLPAQLNNADNGTIAVINGNYAIAAGLNIANALATEDANGPAASLYANIIAVKEGNEQSEKTIALLNALKTQKVYDYINNTFGGAVKPSFTL